MFDLFRSRDKAVRVLLTVLLGLVALSMVTYLIPGSGSGYGGSGSPTVVAEIGDQTLTTQDVSRAIGNITRNRQMPPEMLSFYVPQVLNQMVTDRAMAYEAQRLGIQVTPEEADNAIIDQIPPQLMKDNKVDTATLNAILAEQGSTLADMKSEMLRTIAVSRLRDIVAQGIVVSPKDVENEYRRRNEKIKVEYALLTPAKFGAAAEPTDAEIQSYFNQNRTTFQIPEKRNLGIIVLDPEKLGASIQPSDEDLKKQYTSDADKYRVGERARVRHILLKSDASNDAKIKAKAEDLLKQIKNGGDFAELAKKNSEDPGSAVKGGELDWIVKGQTVPEFEKSAFSLQPGQTSGLVKTMYGYHILQVEAKETAHLKPFEEVKAEIASDYRKRAVNSQMQALIDKALAELRKDPLHPEKAAASVGTTAVTANNVQAGDPIPEIGVQKEFDTAVGSLRKGEVTPGPVVLPGGKVVIASVTDFQPPHPAKLEEVRTEVRNKVQANKLQTVLNQKAQELVKKAQAEGGDLARAAKEMGADLKTSSDFDRNGTVEGIGTGSVLEEAFAKPVGAIVGPVSAQGSRVVAKVVAKIAPDMSGLPTQSASIRDELKRQKGRDRNTLFEDGVKGRLEQQGKLKIHRDVMARIIEGYRQRS